MTDESPEGTFEERSRAKRERAAQSMRYAAYMDRVNLYDRVWPHLEQADGFQAVAYCGTPESPVMSKHGPSSQASRSQG